MVIFGENNYMQITQANLPGLNVEEVIAGINTAEAIFDKAEPIITAIYKKIAAWIESLPNDELSTPHGKRKHIEALEAQNKLQKALNSMYNDNWVTQDTFNKLIAAGIAATGNAYPTPPVLNFVDPATLGDVVTTS